MVDFPKDGVTLEDAIQNYFMVPIEIIGATCTVCKKPVKKSKRINFSDGKEALVVSLNQVLTSQKMNSIKTNKKIKLGGSIAIPMTYGGPPAFYDLVATIQHLGKVRSTGHYVCHIKKMTVFTMLTTKKLLQFQKMRM
jgi:ubiquitin C-terminal hydrolase